MGIRPNNIAIISVWYTLAVVLWFGFVFESVWLVLMAVTLVVSSLEKLTDVLVYLPADHYQFVSVAMGSGSWGFGVALCG